MPGSAEPSEPGEPEELGHDEALSLVVRAVAALIAFVLAAGVGVVLRWSDEGADDADVAATVADGEPLFAGEAPLAGTDVPGYVVRRRAALGRVQGRAVAVVSFDRYRPEGEARTLVEGAAVRAWLVAAPGGEPTTVVGGNLARWAQELKAVAESERSGLVRMAADTDDPAFVAQFKADIDRLTAMLQRIDPRGAVVFGAVVEGDGEVLRTVAGRGGVRLVDVAGREWPGNEEATRYGGVRPEETARAADPPNRPL